MKSFLVALLVGGLGLSLAGVAAAQEGRDPVGDHFEIEWHFGFYSNVDFPSGREENSVYTTFLDSSISPALQPVFRPNIDSNDFRWQGGYRVSFDVSPRWAIEYGFTFTQSENFKFGNDYLETAIPTAQAAGFEVRVLDEESGRLWIHSFNLLFHTRESGRVVPYVTGGFNSVSFGRGPLVEFASGGNSIVLGYPRRSTRFGGNFGGGVKIYPQRHFGFRGDIRFLFSGPRFTERGFVVSPAFGPNTTSVQDGLYSNVHVTFGVFTRF